MSRPKVFEKPAGMKDFLPEAAVQMREVEHQVLDCMQRWGYREIITPTLEYYDTVGKASSTEDRKLFKLLDRNGTTLVMRSDMTTPIARVVSSILKEEAFPIRISYHANVFRAMEDDAGRGAEFYQTGVELVGDATPDADAEVVALAIASLKAAGVETFKIAIGHVGFLHGFFQEMLVGLPEVQQALKDCLLYRDYVGYRDILRTLQLGEETLECVMNILRLRGGAEVCDQALAMTEDSLAEASIKHLCEIWHVLEAYGVSEHVLIDLTMIGDFDYYTGMTFEGYAAGHGFPVCAGGRYDNLLKQFGRPAPATGFSLKTNRILEVIATNEQEQPKRILIIYDVKHRVEALKCAAEYRAEKNVFVQTLLLSALDRVAAYSQTEDGRYLYQGVVYQEIVTCIEEV
ncbi:ATP phosphoribosyltransferase regulatory subunit [Paenibacillus sp. N1-5-1-14]|uniref:ATP phosphoribosyltransferase regulatory subunit n=1 Tax=Paenibacillus radicibacter TaxID=2972488 RepID=UPI002158DC64|nr:ATP phosphoribosyltransferase regulatory subunit [Paenibacillus radicibacter]MCR8643333.1 ATP phosphoribosyltransferase regulatory subunit [Paenibacillus radicibacter]